MPNIAEILLILAFGLAFYTLGASVIAGFVTISRGSGVVGAPAFATSEKGQRISDVVTEALARILRDIRESAQ
jgi:creatinine amidohydrolase/Fe(II)-dependent formamide hydrolase-like protein